ncbi:unnamed protein product [Heligmosomoides polygyrus]|uniref:Uncharacterized protein n=1 Tax=Heligmosomoides polygyrus TaxID=6339 RepID=A0A183GA31_HELPZ|nr:unnamed protein product [Heligmosomoides polygyrus]
MNRFINWIKTRADHNVVSYSRFGLPGDELDDRPPPTVIHVAPFREDSPEFMTFGTHAQRAAVISAGVGLSLVIFIFLAVFFEFDWYHHEKGIDVGALIGMLLFLIIGMLIHWYIVRGIKVGQPRYLVPFIVIYTMLLVIEAVSFIFMLLSTPFQQHDMNSTFRCRNFLEKRLIHDLEMRVAEKSVSETSDCDCLCLKQMNDLS